ncbi:MAG: hypothetical protein RLZZ595_1883 [Bacteroidota bacterium]
MKHSILLFFSICICCFAELHAQQQLGKSALDILKKKEDSLAVLGRQIVESEEAGIRFRSDSQFTRLLVRSLKTPNSFYFPFDSLATISRLYAPDSMFRIFTWQVSRDADLHRRHGAIQMRTNDGSLKLFPLIDRSIIIKNQEDTITNNEWWIGAIYYKILKKEFNNKSYYTLFGYDENSIRSTKKRIEVLTFDAKGNPVFGGNYFTFDQDTVRKPAQSRYAIEYKKNGNGRIIYDEDLDMIIYDHLISESNEPAKKYTYIPDGDYEGFKWINGKWQHIEKVFNQKLEDGQAPVVKPITEKKLPTKKGN